MSALRILAVVLGVALIGGESYRSLGVERSPLLWIDDTLVGALLITAAALLSHDKPRRRAFFTGVWGVTAGALYISLFEVLFDPVAATLGNFTLLQLQIAIGAAFAAACAGFLASLLIPFKAWAGHGAAGETGLWSAAETAGGGVRSAREAAKLARTQAQQPKKDPPAPKAAE